MRRLAALLAGSLLVVASCSSSDDSSVAPATTSADVTTTEPAGPATDPTVAATSPDTEPPATEPLSSELPPLDTAAGTVPDTTGPASPGTIETIGHGDYAVGVKTITITDTVRNRPLTVDVWFPLAAGTTGEPHRYEFVTGDYYQSPFAISAEAESISPDGPFPLVVYSHGSGGQRYISSDYTETIASHGYLVVAPDHTGNTAVERVSDTQDPQPLIALNRPEDIETVIDAMLDPESTETVGFVASTDPERIAVTGHSFGGFTAYAVASGYANELGEVAPDPRIDAIIPLAPAVSGQDPANPLLSDERLASIAIPSLVMVGTNDQTTPDEENAGRAFDLANSEPSYSVELVAGQHNTFTDLCAYLAFFPTLPSVSQAVLDAIESQADQGCSPGDMNITRAHALINTFAISFLDSIFAGGEMIDAATTTIPDDVVFLAK